jgi:acyl carrier protein
MSSQTASIEAKIRGYILENLLFSNDPAELPNDDSLLERGVIDSTGVLEIILFLEGEFGIEVKASEMLPENFDTVDNMVRFVARLQGNS